MATRILAVGTVMVDVLAVGLPAVAEPGEVVYTDIATRIGGHPIDVAIDLVKLGEPAEMVAIAAALGHGPYADFARGVIDEYGIAAFLDDVPHLDTGRNVVIAVQGEDRRFHLDPGANWELSASHVASAISGWGPDVVTLRPGYCGIDLALGELLEPLSETMVFLDIMQPHPARPPHYLRDALRFADVVHCNPREATANTGAVTVDEAVERLLASGVGLVLLTEGDRGAGAFSPEWEVRQPAFVVDTVDPTGCGDAFCAGAIRFLGGRGHPGGLDPDELKELLVEAQAVGASAATGVGCVEGVVAATVTEIMGAQGAEIRQGTGITKRS